MPARLAAGQQGVARREMRGVRFMRRLCGCPPESTTARSLDRTSASGSTLSSGRERPGAVAIANQAVKCSDFPSR
jgi:hypothetical protein